MRAVRFVAAGVRWGVAAARTAKVLLELVELAPAEQLEVMLDPVVLLELLDAFGKSAADPADQRRMSREATKAALGSGTLPGELLRDLLKEHGAAAVWARVPVDRQRVAKAEAPPSLGKIGRAHV